MDSDNGLMVRNMYFNTGSYVFFMGFVLGIACAKFLMYNAFSPSRI